MTEEKQWQNHDKSWKQESSYSLQPCNFQQTTDYHSCLDHVYTNIDASVGIQEAYCVASLKGGILVVYCLRASEIWKKTKKHQRCNSQVASHWQTLSHNVVQLALIEIRTHNISGDGHWMHRQQWIRDTSWYQYGERNLLLTAHQWAIDVSVIVW
jgi:hypothetical protein